MAGVGRSFSVAQSEREAGRGDGGLATAEREELNRLRRKNRQLRLSGRSSQRRRPGSLGDERDPTDGFRFVSDRQADYPIATMCRLRVSPPTATMRG
jgi:hypothetical protein